jgi:hypothetical protein
MSDFAQGKESGASCSDFQTTSHSERFDQNKLSDLMRDLNISNESTELLPPDKRKRIYFVLGRKLHFIEGEKRICCHSLPKTTT